MKNPVFCIHFYLNPRKLKSSSKIFYFQGYKSFEKEVIILMHGKPAMVFFQYQAYLYVKGPSNVWNLNVLCLKNHHHVKCYTRQTFPPPHCRQPSPILYGSITFTIWKRTLLRLNWHYLLKNKGKLYSWGTITYKTAIPNLTVNRVKGITTVWWRFKADSWSMEIHKSVTIDIRGSELCRWFRFAQLAKGKKFRP